MGLEALIPALAGAGMAIIKGIFGMDKPKTVEVNDVGTPTYKPVAGGKSLDERIRDFPRPKD